MRSIADRERGRPPLHWDDGIVSVRCPVCGRVDDQQQLATAPVEWQTDDVVIARCGGCQSIVMSAVESVDDAYVQESWDLYVELTAGIEAIADTLAKVSTGPGARMLDVGCGFGFGLDLGERLRGWRGIGLDPSPAASVGRAALGLDIRTGLLDAEFAPGEQFDVILASELFEHVPDPRSFLGHVRSHLADEGVVVLATPDGSAVGPETPLATLLPALGIGSHVFLVTADGLRTVLESAGLVADIASDGTTLRVVASPTSAGLRQSDLDGSTTLGELVQYCASHATDAPPGSSLGLGMVGRQVKFLAYQGDFTKVDDKLPALREALLARYDIDLEDPAGIIGRPFVPAIVASAGYFSGIVAEYVHGDHDKAVALFTAAYVAGRHHREVHRGSASPEVIAFGTQALGERALVFARVDLDAVRGALRELDAAAARGTCDPAIAADFKSRTEAVMAARFARPHRTQEWVVRAKFAVGTRLRRLRKASKRPVRG